MGREKKMRNSTKLIVASVILIYVLGMFVGLLLGRSIYFNDLKECRLELLQ